jgi:hypothetical protein
MEKYARSDVDHKRRVETRRMMRQSRSSQLGWQYSGQHNPRSQNHQYVFPVQPQQEESSQSSMQPFITYHQTSLVDVTINLHPEEEDPTGVGVEDEAKAGAVDLWIITLSIQTSEENSIATFTPKTQTMAQTIAPKREKKTFERMEVEKNANKLVSHHNHHFQPSLPTQASTTSPTPCLGRTPFNPQT